MPGSGIGTERRTNLVTVLIAFVTLVIGVLGVAAIGSERDVARDADLIALDEASEPADSGDTESAARGSSAEVAHDHDPEATADDEHAHDTVDGATTAGAHADGHAHAVTADSTSDGTDAHAHSHDPTPAAPGSPPTTHGDHQHPADTTPTSAGTPPTTHDPNAHPHDPPVTVPGQPTTPTTTGHSHSGSNVQLIDLPADIQAQVRSATQWAVQYDTTAKASQAGFGQTTSYFPGIAAHYGDTGRIFDRSAGFDPSGRRCSPVQRHRARRRARRHQLHRVLGSATTGRVPGRVRRVARAPDALPARRNRRLRGTDRTGLHRPRPGRIEHAGVLAAPRLVDRRVGGAGRHLRPRELEGLTGAETSRTMRGAPTVARPQEA